MHVLHLGIGFLVAWCAAGGAPAQPVQAKHARVELLSRQSTVTSGTNLLLGIHFVIDPGWHIYWVNPGDSGQPPVFEWRLPAGFSAGEIQWPRPERLQISRTLADFGYRDEVLLMVPVRAPSAISGSSPIQLAVDAKWLICREVCLPDSAQLHLSLPIRSAATANPATAATFAGAQKLLPKALPSGRKVVAESRQDDFILYLFVGKPVAKAEFFPLDPAELDNAAPQKVEREPNGVRIILKKSDLLLKPVTVLRGVLVLTGGDAYHVETRVTHAKGIK